METEILRQHITHITDKLKYSHDEDYAEQVEKASLELINTFPDVVQRLQIIIEAFYDMVDYDNKDRIIASLQSKVKKLEQEVKELKEENKAKDNVIAEQNARIIKLEEDNKQKDIKINKLEKQVNVLMRNHYLIVIAQAYKNLEYYIIQKATGYGTFIMDSINTNLNDFLANENYKTYHEEVARLMKHFEIEKYSASLSKIKRARNNEAHPDPIDIDELKDACESLKTKYSGIERFYEGYQEVNNSLSI